MATKKKSTSKGAKAPKAKPSTLTLRLEPSENTLLEDVKTFTQEKTGTGTIMRVLKEYKGLREAVVMLNQKLKEEEKKQEDLHDLLRRLQGSLADLGKLKLPAPKYKDPYDYDEDDDEENEQY